MKLFNKLLIIVLAILLFAMLVGDGVLAQDDDGDNDRWFPWKLCWFGSTLCLIPIILFVISLAIAIWMYKDAEKRGKSGELWLIIELLFPIIGLIIWLIIRPAELSSQEKRADTM